MKKRAIEEEDDGPESDFEDEAVVVGQIPTVNVPRHIKKRSLKNKALSVSFSEKDLKDFVTGFHKRKKKRRKEAQKQLKEKDRLKRIELRKRRKAEKELALYGGAVGDPTPPELGPDEPGSDEGEDEQTIAPTTETKTYISDCTTITVTTSELNREDDDLRPDHPIPRQRNVVEKNHSLAVKKKPLKGARRPKPQKKSSRKAASGNKDIERRARTSDDTY